MRFFRLLILIIGKNPVVCNNIKNKSLVNQNQGWEPIHQKHKANENTCRHNPKKKQKQTINKNQGKTLWKKDS